jgi:CMP-N-acetylneuraminic acid synthetase
MNRIAVIVPTRKGSIRVNKKNTKNFAGIEGGLLKIKLEQLSKLKGVTIYLTSNDPESIVIGKQFPDVVIKERPEHLCLDSTSLSDLIDYIPSIVEEEHILWTHVTSPLIDSEVYQDSIDNYFQAVDDGFDSLMSVHKIQEFIWSKENKDLLNRGESNLKWPRTQDLDPYYIINSGIFIAPVSIYIEGDRVGVNPFLFEMNSIVSMDVDWEDDFKIAEVLYEKFTK